jgi:hypothetical protein
MSKIYEKYIKQFPEYKSYLHHNSALGCVNQMKVKKEGKVLLQFAGKAIKQAEWQKDSKLKELVDCALSTLNAMKLHSADKKEAIALKADFKAKVKKLTPPVHKPTPPVTPTPVHKTTPPVNPPKPDVPKPTDTKKPIPPNPVPIPNNHPLTNLEIQLQNIRQLMAAINGNNNIPLPVIPKPPRPVEPTPNNPPKPHPVTDKPAQKNKPTPSNPHDLRSNSLGRHINPAHYRVNAEPLVVPQAPAINLFDTFAALWSICEGSWPDNFSIQDDSRQVTKNELSAKLETVFNVLQTSPQYNLLTAESTQLLKDVFGHILNSFDERNQQIEKMQNNAARRKALKELQRDLRLFFQRVGVAFNHCNDRTVTTTTELYSEYILKKPLSPDARENADLEKHLLNRLQEFRRHQFQDGYHHVDTDMHDAATERYVKVQLNQELGLGYPAAMSANDNFASYAIKSKVPDIKREFEKLYTPERILQHVKQLEKSDGLYMKIVNWFETQDPPKHASEIYDQDKDEFYDEALIELLEKLHVIQ